jgi:hypothetical protein
MSGGYKNAYYPLRIGHYPCACDYPAIPFLAINPVRGRTASNPSTSASAAGVGARKKETKKELTPDRQQATIKAYGENMH